MRLIPLVQKQMSPSNGVMAAILVYFTEFRTFAGQVRHHGSSQTHTACDENVKM